jgi:homoserine acetyltransferase
MVPWKVVPPGAAEFVQEGVTVVVSIAWVHWLGVMAVVVMVGGSVGGVAAAASASRSAQ